MINFKSKEYKVAVLGLGYVGLPLAHELAKANNVLGFDTNKSKVEHYINGNDVTNEVGNEKLKNTKVRFSSDPNDLKNIDVYIVAVPTPINQDKTPDLSPITGVSELIATYMTRNSIVVYESTVYPGTTEEICLPILEEISGLKYMEDFELGYSPERINPGDKINTIRKIKKIVSASSEKSLKVLEDIYSSVVDVGLHLAPSIKVAEAAKVIENSQRDVNIAFMNEIAMVFQAMDISTKDVLDAASTKWNFLNFEPGLVGGHCIGVDPYYFIYKAEQLGYRSQIISSARKINDEMPDYVTTNIMEYIIKNKIESPKILCLGLSFKENTADIRNTKVIEIINKLQNLDISVDIYDSLVDKDEARNYLKVDLINDFNPNDYNIIFLAVPHKDIIDKLEDKVIDNEIAMFDLKGRVSSNTSEFYWSL